MRRRILPFVVLTLGILGPACGGGGDGGTGPNPPPPPPPPVVARVELIQAPGNQATNRLPLPAPPIVQLATAARAPVARSGVVVTVSVQGSVGLLLGTLTVVTDSNGRAAFTDLALGGKVGTRRLIFSADSLAPDTSAGIALKAGTPTLMERVSSDSQGGTVGLTVSAAPSVKMLDLDSNPAAGVNVAFRVIEGGGTIGVASVGTTAAGVARIPQWSLGPVPGRNRLVAEFGGPPATLADTFVATSAAGLPTQLVQVAGANQLVPNNGLVPIPPSVRITDAFGNIRPGITVTFTPQNSNDTVTGRTQVSDSAGIATVGSWKVSTQAGTRSLTARITVTGASQTLSVTVQPGPVIGIDLFNGCDGVLNAPTGYVERTCDFRPFDAFGNLLVNYPIQFAVTAGGGALIAADSVTNGAAFAGVHNWTLGPTPGLNELTVTAGGFTRVVQVQTHAGRILTMVAGDSQSVPVASVVPVGPLVKVTDSAGVPVAGVLIQFDLASAPTDGSLATAAPVATDASGIAVAPAWTVGTSTIADSRITAVGTGLAGAPQTFTALVQPGAPHHFVGQGTPPSPALVALPATTSLVAQLADQYGNGVPGQVLQWQASGAGALPGAAAVTDTLGIGRAVGWIYDTTVGANRAVVRSPVLPGDSLVFSVTTIPGPSDTIIVVSGDSQSAPTRHLLPVAPHARVVDRLGHGMSGIGVGTLIGSGGGSLSQSSMTTDGNGEIILAWALGPAPGLQSVNLTGVPKPGRVVAFGVAPPPVAIAPVPAPGLTSASGSALPVPAGVVVTDGSGLGIGGLTVHYAVTAGGGSLALDSAVTDTGGVARVGGWTLGAGGNSLTASVTGLGPTAQVSATGLAPGSAFNIDVTYIGSLPNAATQAAFTAAVTRWQQVIVGDIPDAPLSLPADACITGQPAFNGTIDDLRLYVQVISIDGPGGILGGTGVCLKRTGSLLPGVAVIQLDAADVNTLGSALDEVVLHEVGHALGIGGNWAGKILVQGAGSGVPEYIGPGGRIGYWAARGAPALPINVPVEGQGGPGTADVHWRESSLVNELMTGYLDPPPDPLSLVTAGSLIDLGYQVDLAAADLGFSASLRASRTARALPVLRERPWNGPTFDLDPDGTLRPH